MHAALSYLGTLPDKTIVYNGHEYTKGNLAFAKSVDGANPAVAKLAEIVEKNPSTTGLTTIADEKEWNPFIRLNADAIKCVLPPKVLLILPSSHTVLAGMQPVVRRKSRPWISLGT